MGRLKILKELWNYMKVRKKWWLLPILVILLLLSLLIIFTETTSLGGILYTIF